MRKQMQLVVYVYVHLPEFAEMCNVSAIKTFFPLAIELKSRIGCFSPKAIFKGDDILKTKENGKREQKVECKRKQNTESKRER